MAHLILMSIGPVQDFIAAARRTRDLWFGSHVLSELSRAAADALHKKEAALIMPGIGQTGLADLKYQSGPIGVDGKPVLNVANKILAIVPDGVNPEECAKAARDAIQQTWLNIADDIFDTYSSSLIRVDAKSVWDEQVSSLVEIFAVWTVFEVPEGYAEARSLLESELGARKNLRHFSAWPKQAEKSWPKSSLDGARVSILRKDAANRPEGRRLRLKPGEQLDAVGLIKRAGGDPAQFVSLVNVAYAAWIADAGVRAPQELKALKELCKAKGHGLIHRPDLDWAKSFPFDGHLLNPDRHRQLESEFGLVIGEDLKTAVRDLRGKMERQLHPYVACIVADGDRMGVAIDELKTPEAHQQFSGELSNFARKAREIVEKEYRGILVYAGGDDVLAFVTLPDAIACAKALRDCFVEVMKKALPTDSVKELPTLSVGIGVGHHLETMEYLLDLGRSAEKIAKGNHLEKQSQRNALAICLDKRSGGMTTWRMQWSDAEPVKLFADAVEALRTQTVSSKKIYQLRELVGEFPAAENVSAQDAEKWSRVLGLETQRLLGRQYSAGIAEGDFDPEALGLKLEGQDYKTFREDIMQWTTRFLIARVLAVAQGWQVVEGQEEQE